MSLTPSLGLPYGVVAAFMGHSWNDVAWVVAIVAALAIYVWLVGSASIEWVRDSRARRSAAVDVDAAYFDALAVNSQVDLAWLDSNPFDDVPDDCHWFQQTPNVNVRVCSECGEPPVHHNHKRPEDGWPETCLGGECAKCHFDADDAIARTLAEFDAARRKEDTP